MIKTVNSDWPRFLTQVWNSKETFLPGQWQQGQQEQYSQGTQKTRCGVRQVHKACVCTRNSGNTGEDQTPALWECDTEHVSKCVHVGNKWRWQRYRKEMVRSSLDPFLEAEYLYHGWALAPAAQSPCHIQSVYLLPMPNMYLWWKLQATPQWWCFWEPCLKSLRCGIRQSN